MGLLLSLALALAPPPPARAMDSGELTDYIRKDRLGLSKADKETAMLKLGSKQVSGDLNDSRTARHGAARQFQLPTGMAQETLANPWDGSERADPGRFEALARPDVSARIIDQRTGKAIELPKEVQEAAEEGKEVKITVSGACPSEPTKAIRALQELVRAKVESGETGGAEGDFFLFLYSLFYIPKRFASNVPGVTSGRTVTPTAIATFHRGTPGLMTFDCEKFTGLGAVLQRKIACHEFYHKFNFEGGEAPAYAIMPKC